MWGKCGSSDRFSFLGLQNHCGPWLQPWNEKTLVPWKESYNKPRQPIKKQRCHFADKVFIVKAMVFQVVTYGCESWTIKKVEHWRTDAFELWCWRKLLSVPWTARGSNQSVLKEINPECSLEGLMLSSDTLTVCAKSCLFGRLWCWEGLKTKGERDSEDEMVR